jgi:DNA-binding transcriptional MerR regulator/methylmalonyl-CoA mutase cobalamin-binding subunit
MRTDYTIQKAALQAGLTPHVLRAWERRYAALTPQRTPSNRRLYTDKDIERLSLLRQTVQSGHNIGRVVGLPSEELRRLIAEASALDSANEVTPSPTSASPLDEGLRAIDKLDAWALERYLARSASSLGTAVLIDQVVVPLLKYLGEGWREGSVRIANEHMASVVLRTHLLRTLGSFQPPAPAPCLVVTTPAGQHHEFGALLVAVTAALEGWRVLYLGTNLPAEEIAGAVQRSGAIAVGLSIVYPPDDPLLSEELRTLRRCLGDEVLILASGREAAAYRHALRAISAVMPDDLHGLRVELEAVRSR